MSAEWTGRWRFERRNLGGVGGVHVRGVTGPTAILLDGSHSSGVSFSLGDEN